MIPFPLIAGLLIVAGLPRNPPALKVTPEAIEVGSFYNGANVRVEGMAAAGSRVILTVVGSAREERFNRKARFGPIWINSGKVRISGVPSLFLRFSSGPVAGLLRREEIERRQLDQISLTSPIDPAIRSSYLALKKSEGSYSFGDGGVTMVHSAESERFALEFRWPKRAPPARYEVRVYEVLDGAIAGEASVPLSVVRTGFPAWLAGLAENRAALYGMTAVLIGALAGFGIDFLTTRIFGKKRAAH